MAKKGTETKADDFKFIDIDQLTASATNPRKSFVNQEITDLAKSIGEKGVLQPLLVRKVDSGFEIIAGERRYRASKIAGLKEIPCIVRNLTDQQILEVQVVENMQRADLSPLEEAQGYSILHETHGYDWTELAKKIGKSKNYIYSRLKLLSLIPEFQKALMDGAIVNKDEKDPDDQGQVVVPNFNLSWAEQIIRIQDPNDQKKLYQEMKEYYGIMELDEVKTTIEDEYLLQLKKAPFSTKDSKLTGGPCGECAKRTGANPDLFGELAGKTDSCQDPACWAGKKQQTEENILSKFKKQIDAGRKVIIGDAAAEILCNLDNYSAKYNTLDCQGAKLKGSTTWAQALKGTEYLPIIAVDASGKSTEVVEISAALKYVPKDKIQNNSSTGGETPEQTKKRKEKEAAAAKVKELTEKATEEALKQILPELIKKVDSLDMNSKGFILQLIDYIDDCYGCSKVPEIIAKVAFANGKVPSLSKTRQAADAKALKRVVAFQLINDDMDLENNPGLQGLLNLTGLLEKFKQLIKENIEKASVKKGVCKVCGCTEDNACCDKDGETTCSWTDKTETLCTSCRGKEAKGTKEAKKKGKGKK